MKKAFEEVYNDFYFKVYHYILKKINNSYDAEDLTHDIFVACYKNYSGYDPEKASLSTWIFTITNNKLKNYYRDRKIFVSLDKENECNDIQDVHYTEEAVILEEQKNIILMALNKLSEREKNIIEQKYFKKLKSKEIAINLGIKDSNVRVILKRALKKLYKYLKDDNFLFE